MGNPDSSLDGLVRTAAFQQLEISSQGLDKRFTEASSTFARQVLEAAISQTIQADSPVDWELTRRFKAVYVHDSTQIALPAELALIWQGTGGGTTSDAEQANKASLKVDLMYDLNSGETRIELMAGRHSDNRSPLLACAVEPGSLHLKDLGYFNLERMKEQAERGEFWLSRLLSGTNVYTTGDTPKSIDLGAELQALSIAGITVAERQVLVGAEVQLPARLIMVRLSPESAARQRAVAFDKSQKRGRTPSARHLALCDWWLLITNVPESLLSKNEAPNLYGARWQIELMFKLWKSGSHLATSRSGNKWRILCEIYIKLLIVLIQHWILLTGLWEIPQRSLTKGVQAIQEQASNLAACVGDSRNSLVKCIKRLAVVFVSSSGCRQNRRRRKPNNWLNLQKVRRLGA